MAKKFERFLGVISVMVLGLFFSCATTQVAPSDILGTWFCTLSSGENMEISLNGNAYNIKINGVDNNRGKFKFTKRYGQDHIIFRVGELINAQNKWVKTGLLRVEMPYQYKLENGELTLIGGVYKGTYTKNVLPDATNDKYFVNINGNQVGPYSIKELRQFVTLGQINRETLVWKEGMLQWQQAGMITDFSDLWRSLPPPLPPR